MADIDLAKMGKQNGKSELECAKLVLELLMWRSYEWDEKITVQLRVSQ